MAAPVNLNVAAAAMPAAPSPAPVLNPLIPSAGECEKARKVAYEQLGKMLPLSGKWENIPFYMLQRTNNSIAMVSSGLSDPPHIFPEGTGMGVEIIAETPSNEIDSFCNGMWDGIIKYLKAKKDTIQKDLFEQDRLVLMQGPNHESWVLMGIRAETKPVCPLPRFIEMPGGRKCRLLTVRLLTGLRHWHFQPDNIKRLEQEFIKEGSYHITTKANMNIGLRLQPAPAAAASAANPPQRGPAPPPAAAASAAAANPPRRGPAPPIAPAAASAGHGHSHGADQAQEKTKAAVIPSNLIEGLIPNETVIITLKPDWNQNSIGSPDRPVSLYVSWAHRDTSLKSVLKKAGWSCEIKIRAMDKESAKTVDAQAEIIKETTRALLWYKGKPFPSYQHAVVPAGCKLSVNDDYKTHSIVFRRSQYEKDPNALRYIRKIPGNSNSGYLQVIQGHSYYLSLTFLPGSFFRNFVDQGLVPFLFTKRTIKDSKTHKVIDRFTEVSRDTFVTNWANGFERDLDELEKKQADDALVKDAIVVERGDAQQKEREAAGKAESAAWAVIQKEREAAGMAEAATWAMIQKEREAGGKAAAADASQSASDQTTVKIQKIQEIENKLFKKLKDIEESLKIIDIYNISGEKSKNWKKGKSSRNEFELLKNQLEAQISVSVASRNESPDSLLQKLANTEKKCLENLTLLSKWEKEVTEAASEIERIARANSSH